MAKPEGVAVQCHVLVGHEVKTIVEFVKAKSFDMGFHAMQYSVGAMIIRGMILGSTDFLISDTHQEDILPCWERRRLKRTGRQIPAHQ